MDFTLVYIAGAAWLAAVLAYYYLTRKPLQALPVGGLAVALAFIALYPWIMSWYNQRAVQDFATLDAARQCVLNTIGAAAAHVSFAVDVILDAIGILAAPFTLGLSFAAAQVLAETLINAFTTAVESIVFYLTQAETFLSAITAATQMVSVFAALGVPLLAIFVPDRRGAAVAAVVASLPVIFSAPFLLAPPLSPLPCGQVAVPPPIYTSAVNATANAPVVWVFNGTAATWNGSSIPVVVVVGASRGGKIYLPAGDYRVTAIWSFIPIDLGVIHVKPTYPTNATVQITVNNTKYNATLPDVPAVANITAEVASYVDGWIFASNETPAWTESNGTTYWYYYEFTFGCYGTTSTCPSFDKTITALGQITGVEVKVLSVENMTYYYEAGVHNATSVSPAEWNEILKIGQAPGSTIVRLFQPKYAGARIYAEPTPVYQCVKYVNGTCVEEQEVPATHSIKVLVVFQAKYIIEPALAGIKYGQYTTSDWVSSLLALASGSGLTGPLAAYLGTPIVWIITSLVPFIIRIVYAELTIVLGVSGLLVLLGAGNTLWRWLGLDILSKIQWRFDPFRTPLRLMRASGKGISSSATTIPVTANVTKDVVKPVVASMTSLTTKELVRRYIATAGRLAEMVYYGDPMFWPAYGIEAAAMYRHLRSTDYTLTRREAFAKALYYTFTVAGHEYARKLDSMIYWFGSLAYLRLDRFAALGTRKLYEAYQDWYALTGSRRLAAELALAYPRRPVSATDAAFYVLYVARMEELKGVKYFYPLVGEVAERASKLLGREVTAEEVARRWLALYGYDYDKLAYAMKALGLDYSPQTIVSLPALSTFAETAAKRLIEMGEYGAAAAFKWTQTVKEFEARYAQLESLASGDREAWAKYIRRLYAEEWAPLKAELPRPSELVQMEATLKWYADNLRLIKGEWYVNDRGYMLPFAAAAEKLVDMVKDIIPEDLAWKGAAKMDPAVLIKLANEERSVDRLVELYAKNAPVEELVEEARRLMELGRPDLAAKLGDAAELAAMARAVEVMSRPVEPVHDLAKLVALGLDEEQAKFVYERYGSAAIEWLKEARVPRMEEEPSRLLYDLAATYRDEKAYERVARELEEILGWRPTKEQIDAVRDLYTSVAGPLPDEEVERIAKAVEKTGVAEAPRDIAERIEGYAKIETPNDTVLVMREDVAGKVGSAIADIVREGSARVEDVEVAMALYALGYHLEPVGRFQWIATKQHEENPPTTEAPVEEIRPAIEEPKMEIQSPIEAERPIGQPSSLEAAVEEPPEVSERLRIEEELHRLAADHGVFLSDEQLKEYVEKYGPSALNAWAEDYAAQRYGEWARGYIEEVGWKGLETLRHYEAVEETARRIGVDIPREEALKLAEKYGEEAPERLVDMVAERIAKELKTDFETTRELVQKYGVEEAVRRLREEGRNPT